MSFHSPLLSSSPPAKSPSLPIKARGGLSRSLTASQAVVQKAEGTDRRSSETGQRQSFSFSKTPFASLASASTVSGGAARPSARPPAAPSLRVEGFSAPESQNVALSPGKLQTKSSLLTASLLEPAATFSSELFGAVQPAHGFQVSRRWLCILVGKMHTSLFLFHAREPESMCLLGRHIRWSEYPGFALHVAVVMPVLQRCCFCCGNAGPCGAARD